MNGERSVREEVLALLRQREVRHIFGNPGTTELGLISGLPSDVDYVLCLQESIAVAAATGYALMSGRPGVVNLHAAPGLGHGMGALHGARLMHAPLVAITGQQDSAHLASEPLLSGDLVDTARSATRRAIQVGRPEDVVGELERAFRIATTPPMGPAMVAVPMDFWEGPAGAGVVACHPEAAHADGSSIDRVRARLAASTHGALVTGDRINDRSSWDAAVAVADTFDLDVYAAPIGIQPGFPTDHPRYRGNLPLVTSRLHSALETHDVVLVAGASMFTTYLYDGVPAIPEDTTFLLLSDDPAEAARAAAALIVLGDPGASLVGLSMSARPAAYRSTQAEVVDPAGAFDLGSVMRAINAQLPQNVVFVDESMTSGSEVRSALRVAEPRQYLRTSNGVLGTGLPAAIGAALGRPDRRVVAFLGDGSVMYAPQALWTAARLGLDITVIVLDNSGYESLRGYERAHLPERAMGSPSFDITGIDLAALAGSMGVKAASITSLDHLRSALDEAFQRAGPMLIDVALDG